MCFRRTRKSNPEAERALAEAKEHLTEARDRNQEVRSVAEASKEFRRKNHFADQLQTLFEGGGGDSGEPRHRGA